MSLKSLSLSLCSSFNFLKKTIDIVEHCDLLFHPMEYLKSSSIRVPGGGDKVFKDECVYCFDSPVCKFATVPV